MDQKVEEAAINLHKAMQGIGTDEKSLIKEIVSHNNAFRQLVKEKYMTLYGKVNNCAHHSYHGY